MWPHLAELRSAIAHLLLIRSSVGTLAHEEMIFRLEVEDLLQRRELAPARHPFAGQRESARAHARDTET